MSDDTVAVRHQAGALDVTVPPDADGPPTLPGLAARVLAWLRAATWLWPAVATAVLCMWRLGYPVLWQDELVTLDVARRSLGQISGLIHRVDAVHAAYYTFMHFWVKIFGDSVFALRLPSALAMAAAAGVIVLIARRLYDDRVGLVAGLAFAVIPAVTRFGQEARSYGFVVLAAALATLFLLRAVERPTVLGWALYAISLAAMFVLNAVSGAIIVGHLVGLVILLWRRWAWRPVAGFVLAVGVAGVLARPVLVLGRGQALRQVIWIPHSALFEAWETAVASMELAYAIIALALLAWLRPRRATAFMSVLVVLPLLVVWLYSLGEINYFFSKYLLFTLPAWAVLVGAGLRAVPWRPAAIVGLVALAALGLPDQVAVRSHLSHSWYTYPLPREALTDLDYEAAAAIIAAGYQPGDGIVYQRGANWWRLIDVGVRYYLPARVQPRDIFLKITAADDLELRSLECAAECLGDEARVWVVVSAHTDDVFSQLDWDQAVALHGVYYQAWYAQPPGLTVALVERWPGV